NSLYFSLLSCTFAIQGTHITYTQAGVSCFVGQKSDKYEVQFFVGSPVVKISACVKLRTVEKLLS
ncbi:MAG: hypothetical protein WAT79_05390, partial [Saprospiraceae bacterium]